MRLSACFVVTPEAPQQARQPLRRPGSVAPLFRRSPILPIRHHRRPDSGVLALATLLFVLPLVVYGSAVFHRYGLRDDYAILREAREDPGKIPRVLASQGRPIYGWLLERSAHAANTIDGLSGLRLLGVVGLGLLGASLFLLLRREGWPLITSALLAALLTLTPSAQVIASWGICWPQAVALVLGVAAFGLARRGLPPPSEPATGGVGWRIAAAGVIAVATLIYQASGLVYAVLLAAVLVLRHDDHFRDTMRWLMRHLTIMGAGLLMAFAVTKTLFLTGMVTPSPRIAFETHWVDKTLWAITHVLPNALALIALNDTPTGMPAGSEFMVAATLAVLAVGLAVEVRRGGLRGGGRWLLVLLTLSAAAYSVSFLAFERWPTYRTLYALTGVWGVFVAGSLMNLGSCWPRRGPWVMTSVLALFVGAGALLAHRQSLELFALPQARELALMEQGARQVEPAKQSRVFVLTARQTDTSAPRRYLDEFGSVSVDAEWVAKEMLKALMKERFPLERDPSHLYRFAAGPNLPEPRNYDILIDMRKMRQGG
ncbi:glucosyltransferase domain-containing protein [Myxococcaceae bacterium JPH2]|nr:glucosyltransferase domain-containing protein [Myxococcaceae bacterium JPH2]